jgi:mono/diheme cytochrome c family protein
MGHAPNSGDMSAAYRERIDDDRLRAVVKYVRQWLLGTEETK